MIATSSNSAQKLSQGLGTLPTEQLACVPQVVEWGIPGVLHARLVRHTTENLTANHSGAPCWERCHVPSTLKNPAVVFGRSRNLWAPPQETKLPNPTHPPHLSCGNQNLLTLLSLCPIPFFFISSSFHVHFIIHIMFIVWIYLKCCCSGVNQSINLFMVHTLLCKCISVDFKSVFERFNFDSLYMIR